MIKLKSIINEEAASEAVNSASSYFKAFTKELNYNATWTHLGLKNGENIFTAPLKNLGALRMIFSEATLMARVSKDKAYFGIIYMLNGLEQFDATVCLIKKTDSNLEIKMFDDGDADFSDAKTNFANIIKVMV
jgi:hypothetical protein